ncbi:60S ribosomal protein L27a-like isoform X3 [Oreochromis niloticus]|uniref:60S ribosomal protein L27a-like isoform X3 n=2 Tax=Oreochromis niloticus TaxID=8128 RepID=UPI000DF3EC46|nr:60S ribosomal protein L27a-like isoform X3 [Oreochromis niloticus]
MGAWTKKSEFSFDSCVVSIINQQMSLWNCCTLYCWGKSRTKSRSFRIPFLFRLASKMPTRKSKTRKLRGHASHGHGRVGKHRKHPGGRGNAGGMHHHRINFDKYHPGYFGKAHRRHTSHCPTINLDKLWTLVSEQTRINYSKKPDGPAPIIDAVRAGYYKVLGKGKLPKQPVIVKAKFFSRQAEKKIKAVGGACVLMA